MPFPVFPAYHENFVDCPNIKFFQFENSPTNRKLSFSILMDEVKPILMEKCEFDYWNMPKFFGPFWTIRVPTLGSRFMVFLLNSAAQLDSYRWSS